MLFRSFQIVSNQIVLGQIIGTTSKIAKLSTDYFSVVLSGNLPARFDKIVTSANKLINLKIGLEGDKVFKGGWLDSFFKSNTTGLELKEMTSKAVTSNMNMKDYVKLLREKITGSEKTDGLLERQFQRYGYNLYQQYDAAYNLTLGNEFGFNYFI